jgi:hypothetical protein
MGNRRQHKLLTNNTDTLLLTHCNDLKMETIDDDNGEVSMRKMAATAKWNLLEDTYKWT